MRIPFVQGRAFDRQEYGAPTLSAIIDDELAAESFSDRSALGAPISQGRPGTIVGVIPSVKQYDLTEPRKGIIYWTYPHFAWFQSMNIVMRSALSPDAAAGAIRAAVNGIDPRIPVYAVRPLADRVNDSLGAHRLTMLVLIGFGGAALLLALIGMYGVMSYVMGERTREVGIRVALGARRGQLIGLVLQDGATMVALGVALGLAVFAGGGRILRAMLYEVSALDPVSLAAAATVSVLTALGACYVAARRSTAIDVMSALRSD
jgi:ABC-type antimicrobial peptide transport system permease subunit